MLATKLLVEGPGNGSPEDGHVLVSAPMVEIRNIFTFDLRTRFGELGERTVPELINGLRKAEPIYRTAYFELLSEIGAPAVPHLVALLLDTNAEIREEAASALGTISGNSETICDALTKSLFDEDRAVSIASARALSKFNAASDVAVPLLLNYARGFLELRASMDDVAEHVCMEVLEAIARFSPPRSESVDVLISALCIRSVYVRTTAVRALGKMGAVARDAIPALRAIVELPSVSGSTRGLFDALRLAAIQAIAQIDDNAC